MFASNAARDAAVTAPAEGNFAFTKDTNSLWYYDGAAWVASGATGDIEGVTAGVGISGGGTSGTVTVTNSMATEIAAKGDLIVGTGSQTFDNLTVGTNGHVLTADSTVSPTGLKWAAPAATGGLTLIQTTSFSAVAGQIINDVFSSTYDNYRIMFNATSAASLTLTMRLRVAGSDASGTDYVNQGLFVAGASVTAGKDTGQTSWPVIKVRTNLSSPFMFDIYNPAKASPTVAYNTATDMVAQEMQNNVFSHSLSTAYDGFNLTCSTSNMTGAVSIYGYNK